MEKISIGLTQFLNEVKVSLKKTFSKNNFKKVFDPNLRLTTLIPYFIIAVIFILLPFVFLITNATAVTSKWENPQDLAKAPETWQIMFASIGVGLAAALIAIVITLPFAYFASRMQNKALKLIVILLFISPLLVFTVAKVYAVKSLMLQAFDGDSSKLHGRFLQIIALAYLFTPYAVIPMYTTLDQLPSNLVNASKDLGYGPIKTFFKVIVPFATKAIFSAFAMVFMLAATSIVVTQVIENSTFNKDRLIGNMIDRFYSNDPTNSVNISKASMIALITLPTMFVVYSSIYLIPWAWRKIKGGVNV